MKADRPRPCDRGPGPHTATHRSRRMRFLCMHKASPKDEAGIPPPPDLIAGMQQLIGEACHSGTFLAGEGLRPSSTRYRLTFRGGDCDVRQGPFTGDNDLPQRLVILKVDSIEAAIDWARRFGQAAGATRLELGPLTEPWDVGMMPKPPGKVPLRFLLLQQATATSEAGTPPSPAQQQAIRGVLAAMQKAGVLVFSETLLPSSKGARLHYRDNARRRVDGPFTESKELIGGFCMMQMRSLDEVAAFSDRFARVVGGTCEIDLRTVAEGDGGRS